MPFLRRRWPWLLVILFPLLPLWRAVFLAEAIGPFDQIRQMAPWNGPAPDRPFDVLQADAVLQFYPWRDMVFDAWGKMQLPLWNPYQLAGTPLLANSQSAGFYPPHIFLGLMHVPTHWAITLLAWFHLALAGLGVMALARRLGATSEGGAIGGVLFSGSAFMLAWTALPSVISTVAWIPWVLYGVYGLFENRSSLITFAGLAFATGMMLLAGHLQFAFYGLLGAIVVLLFLFVFSLFDKSYKTYKTNLRSLFLGILGLGVGGGLAAPQLLPVLEYSKFSHRRNVASEEGYKAYVAGAIAPFELVGLIYPTAVGLPFEFAPEAKPLSQYWPALVKQGANFAEGAIGIGPLALFGLLIFPWRRTPKKFWVPLATLGVLAFLMALGTIVNKPFYFLIPGWSSTGSPGRIGVLFLLATFVISAISISKEALVAERNMARDLVGISGTIIAIVGTLIAANWATTNLSVRFPNMDPDTLKTIGKQGGLFSSMLASFMLVAAFQNLTRLKDSVQSTRWIFLVLFSFVPSGFFLFKLVDSDMPLEMSNGIDSKSTRAAFINDPWELIVAAPATMPPNTASLFRMHDLGGYDSLLHKDTHLFLGYVNGQDPAPPANGNMQFIKPTADPLKLLEAGVTDVYSRAPVIANRQPETMENGLLHYQLAPQARAIFIRPGKTQPFVPIKVQDGYDRQFIDVTGPGMLVVKDRLMPGWKAIVGGAELPWSKHPAAMWKSPDGREVQMWRAVEIPDGRFNVDFVYDPPGLKTGMIIFIPCLLLTLGGWTLGNRKSKTDQK